MDKELEFQLNMIQGNISRVCVTDDIVELNEQFNHAQDRLKKIFKIRETKLLTPTEPQA